MSIGATSSSVKISISGAYGTFGATGSVPMNPRASKCDCCGFVGSQDTTINYMTMFYRNSCKDCGTDVWICDGCISSDGGNRYPRASQTNGTGAFCGACKRDKKLDTILL